MLKLLFQHFLFSLFFLSLILPLNNLLNFILLNKFFSDLLAVLFLSHFYFILCEFVLKINVFFVLQLFEHVLLNLFLELLFHFVAGCQSK